MTSKGKRQNTYWWDFCGHIFGYGHSLFHTSFKNRLFYYEQTLLLVDQSLNGNSTLITQCLRGRLRFKGWREVLSSRESQPRRNSGCQLVREGQITEIDMKREESFMKSATCTQSCLALHVEGKQCGTLESAQTLQSGRSECEHHTPQLTVQGNLGYYLTMLICSFFISKIPMYLLEEELISEAQRDSLK